MAESRAASNADTRATIPDEGGLLSIGRRVGQPGGRQVVLINGIPASGKSTLAAELSARTGWLQLSLDGIKNPFLQYLQPVDREFNRVLGRASYQAIWSIVANAPQGSTLIIDAWFGFQPKEILLAYLAQAGITGVAEVWCEVSGDIAIGRYKARLEHRLPGHPGEEYLPELKALAERAEPMNIGPVYRADQNVPLDIEKIINWIFHAFESPVDIKVNTLRS